MYTTSSVFLKTLSQSGITHAFVNWGSDHPALLEELARQRDTGGKTELAIVTCPNEMVALSAAQGYAQVTGRPAAVLVHVDVGTQALAGAVHNVDRCRVPVLIYAGASPFSTEGEIKGSRNEWIMWIQDVPDQSAIVRQYMRFTAQIHSGKNVNHVVMRALQSATSEPKGPVYLWARREAMEEEVDETVMNTVLDANKWSAVEPSALSPSAVTQITEALTAAKSPLIITSYLGRNPHAVEKLVSLSDALAIPVIASTPATVNFPASHPHFAGVFYGMGPNDLLTTADVVLVIDADVPYIPMRSHPRADARVFHIDVDVLKDNIGLFHIDAELRCRADAALALAQLLAALPPSALSSPGTAARAARLAAAHAERERALDAAERAFAPDSVPTVPNIAGALRRAMPPDTLVLSEAITNYPLVWEHMRASAPGTMLTSGAASLGWGLGAAVGASLGTGAAKLAHKLIVLVVGDGSFMFGVPSSAYWMARKYNTPFLTIVLNNGGWRAPKLSMLGVYPSGIGSSFAGTDLTVGFGPETPDYAQIAVAAGGAWGKRVVDVAELDRVIQDGVNVVLQEGRCAVVDCVIQSI